MSRDIRPEDLVVGSKCIRDFLPIGSLVLAEYKDTIYLVVEDVTTGKRMVNLSTGFAYSGVGEEFDNTLVYLGNIKDFEWPYEYEDY